MQTPLQLFYQRFNNEFGLLRIARRALLVKLLSRCPRFAAQPGGHGYERKDLGRETLEHAAPLIDLLRFKPVGRGAHKDDELTPAQARRIYPLARRLMLRHRIRVKLDCSFAPMVFWHRPSPRAAAFWGVQGCVAGDVLAAVAPEGTLMACSFAGGTAVDARIPGNIRSVWASSFAPFREFVASAPEPCASCDYLRLCRGGCRAVANAHGRQSDPDPGCPRVQEWRARHRPRGVEVSVPPAEEPAPRRSFALPVVRG